jgi:hypothetical protein
MRWWGHAAVMAGLWGLDEASVFVTGLDGEGVELAAVMERLRWD